MVSPEVLGLATRFRAGFWAGFRAGFLGAALPDEEEEEDSSEDVGDSSDEDAESSDDEDDDSSDEEVDLLLAAIILDQKLQMLLNNPLIPSCNKKKMFLALKCGNYLQNIFSHYFHRIWYRTNIISLKKSHSMSKT